MFDHFIQPCFKSALNFAEAILFGHHRLQPLIDGRHHLHRLVQLKHTLAERCQHGVHLIDARLQRENGSRKNNGCDEHETTGNAHHDEVLFFTDLEQVVQAQRGFFHILCHACGHIGRACGQFGRIQSQHFQAFELLRIGCRRLRSMST